MGVGRKVTVDILRAVLYCTNTYALLFCGYPYVRLFIII